MDWNQFWAWAGGAGGVGLIAVLLKIRQSEQASAQVNFDTINKNLEAQRARLSDENKECDELLLEAQKIIQHLNAAATHQGVKTFLLNRIRREAFEDLEQALKCLAEMPDGCAACHEAEIHIRRAVKGLKEDIIVPTVENERQ